MIFSLLRCRTSFPLSSFVAIHTKPSTPTAARTALQYTPRAQYRLNIRTMASATTFYEFAPKDKKGEPYDTNQLQGKVVLIVNTATKCGFTPQLKDLEAVYKELKASPKGDDFECLGFPCNQFGNQNPEDDDKTQEFCAINYGVSFPVLGKLDVNGKTADPMYEWLKKSMPGLLGMQRVKWNFEKFLVGRDGKVKQRWASTTKPPALKKAIEEELAKEPPAEMAKA